jgi:hypothetical protein
MMKLFTKISIYFDAIMMHLRILPMTLVIVLTAKIGFAGDIRRFTDSKGILHISNVENGVRPDPRQFQELARTGSLPGKLPIIPLACESPPPTDNSAPPLDITKAAASEGETGNQPHSVEEMFQRVYEAAQVLNTEVAGAGKPAPLQEAFHPPQLAHPPSRSSIISFKDLKGVIHITCRPEREAKSTIQIATGSTPPEKPRLPDVGQSGCPQVTWPVPQIHEAAFSRTVLPTRPSDLIGNTIRGYLDRKGVWRITNNPPPEISPAIPMGQMVQTASTPGTTSVPSPQELNPLPAMVIGQPANRPLPGAGSQTIIARRDQRGTNHIFNLAAASGGAPGSPVSFLEKLPPGLEPIIVEAAQLYRLPVSLILALIRNESNFASRAISPKGAMGLMQLMPDTATLLGVQDPFSPRENILGGCRYFRYLLDCFQGSVPLALAAYNAGSQRVISAGYQVPPIKETQGFVTQVLAQYYLLEKLSALRL